MTLALAAFLGFVSGFAACFLLSRSAHALGQRVNAAAQDSPLAEVTDESLARVVGRRRPRTMRD